MPSNFDKLVEARIAETKESWATAARIVRSQGAHPRPEPSGEEKWNSHPAHEGFISQQELDWVMETATPSSANGDRSQAPYDRIYFWLIEYRGGSVVPIPSYKMVRNSWSLDAPHPAAMKWAKAQGEF